MIERLVHFLNREMEQRSHAMMVGIVSDYNVFVQLRAEYRTLSLILEEVNKYIAEEEGEDESMADLK